VWQRFGKMGKLGKGWGKRSGWGMGYSGEKGVVRSGCCDVYGGRRDVGIVEECWGKKMEFGKMERERGDWKNGKRERGKGWGIEGRGNCGEDFVCVKTRGGLKFERAEEEMGESLAGGCWEVLGVEG
jgi:hypothetical protein